MASIASQPGPSPGDDYYLDNIPRDHHQITHHPSKGLGIFNPAYIPDGYASAYHEEPHYVHNPPTPRSNTDDGIRTGRTNSNSGVRNDSPFASSSPKSRISQSPMLRPTRKDKKSKLDKSKTPKLTAPLSVLTKDMHVPLRDMGAWVNRSAAERAREVEKRNGYVTRPMNSFMLYRSAFAERTKQWCLQNNHQVVSSVSGESWPMEPPEIREKYNEWARIERNNHSAAHPQYKFSPSKAASKRGRRGDFSDDEDGSLDLEDPEGDFRGPRVKRRPQANRESPYLHQSDAFAAAQPYYGSQYGVYASPEYQQVMPVGRPLPSNVSYDQYGQVFDQQTRHYYMSQQQPQFSFSNEQQAVRMPTPTSMTSAGRTSLGGFGMPGSSSNDDLFASPRTPTSVQSFDSFGRPMYYHPQQQQPQQQQQHQQQPAGMNVYAFHPTFHTSSAHAHPEHHQYMHSDLQTSPSVDPSLSVAFPEFSAAGGVAAHHRSHFETALGDGFGPAEYYDQHTSPTTTLAPQWSPADELKKSEY